MTVKSPKNLSPDSNLVRIGFRLDKDVYEYIQLLAATGGSNANFLMRTIIGSYVRQMRSEELKRLDGRPKISPEIASEARELLEGQ